MSTNHTPVDHFGADNAANAISSYGDSPSEFRCGRTDIARPSATSISQSALEPRGECWWLWSLLRSNVRG
jgi:hypothetical protein